MTKSMYNIYNLEGAYVIKTGSWHQFWKKLEQEESLVWYGAKNVKNKQLLYTWEMNEILNIKSKHYTC